VSNSYENIASELEFEHSLIENTLGMFREIENPVEKAAIGYALIQSVSSEISELGSDVLDEGIRTYTGEKN
jgi:hypothetical protein